MISIVIPVHNEEKAIGKTLAHLKQNLHLPHEIIVTDNASTDATVSIVEKHVPVFIPSAKYPSIAANRNAGAKVASGDFLVFIDADVIIPEPDVFFARALDHFRKHPDVVALTVQIAVDERVRTLADRIVYSIFNSIHSIKNNVLAVGEASGKLQMIKKNVFDQVGGYREDLITREDGEMFHRLSKVGRTSYLGDLVVYHGGRRAHQFGWPKLLAIWLFEAFWFAMFDKSYHGNWRAVR